MNEKEKNFEKRKLNIWMISTFILAVLLVAALIFIAKEQAGILSEKEASDKFIKFMGYLSSQSLNVTSVEDTNGLYKISFVSDVTGEAYLTKDGNILLSGQVLPDNYK
jgi:hypothetical protein